MNKHSDPILGPDDFERAYRTVSSLASASVGTPQRQRSRRGGGGGGGASGNGINIDIDGPRSYLVKTAGPETDGEEGEAMKDLTSSFDLKGKGLDRSEVMKAMVTVEKSARVVDLSSNGLVSVPFLPQSICVLSIANNEISSLDDLESLDNLKELDISRNNISSLEGLYNCSHCLTVINASFNQLESVSGLETMLHLKYLDLSNNYLSKLSSIRGLSCNISLMELRLKGNGVGNKPSIRQLMMDLVPSLLSLDDVKLSKSPAVGPISKNWTYTSLYASKSAKLSNSMDSYCRPTSAKSDTHKYGAGPARDVAFRETRNPNLNGHATRPKSSASYETGSSKRRSKKIHGNDGKLFEYQRRGGGYERRGIQVQPESPKARKRRMQLEELEYWKKINEANDPPPKLGVKGRPKSSSGNSQLSGNRRQIMKKERVSSRAHGSTRTSNINTTATTAKNNNVLSTCTPKSSSSALDKIASSHHTRYDTDRQEALQLLRDKQEMDITFDNFFEVPPARRIVQQLRSEATNVDFSHSSAGFPIPQNRSFQNYHRDQEKTMSHAAKVSNWLDSCRDEDDPETSDPENYRFWGLQDQNAKKDQNDSFGLGTNPKANPRHVIKSQRSDNSPVDVDSILRELLAKKKESLRVLQEAIREKKNS